MVKKDRNITTLQACSTFIICRTNSWSLSLRDWMKLGSKLLPRNRFPGSLRELASLNFFLSFS